MASDPTHSSDVLVMYRAKPGLEDVAEALVQRHWPTLARLGVATAAPSRVWRALDAAGATTFFEVFTWAEGDALGRADKLPEITALWDEMSAKMAGMEILRAAPVAIG